MILEFYSRKPSTISVGCKLQFNKHFQRLPRAVCCRTFFTPPEITIWSEIVHFNFVATFFPRKIFILFVRLQFLVSVPKHVTLNIFECRERVICGQFPKRGKIYRLELRFHLIAARAKTFCAVLKCEQHTECDHDTIDKLARIVLLEALIKVISKCPQNFPPQDFPNENFLLWPVRERRSDVALLGGIAAETSSDTPDKQLDPTETDFPVKIASINLLSARCGWRCGENSKGEIGVKNKQWAITKALLCLHFFFGWRQQARAEPTDGRGGKKFEGKSLTSRWASKARQSRGREKIFPGKARSERKSKIRLV